MAHVRCMLDTLGYKHKLPGKYNTYSFSTATVVAQTCLNVSWMYFACLGNGTDVHTKSNWDLNLNLDSSRNEVLVWAPDQIVNQTVCLITIKKTSFSIISSGRINTYCIPKQHYS
jgi:hypothetical protein